MNKSISKQANGDKQTVKSPNGKDFKLPTIDQFMELVTAEQTTLATTPSGYNVYNKYNKTS